MPVLRINCRTDGPDGSHTADEIRRSLSQMFGDGQALAFGKPSFASPAVKHATLVVRPKRTQGGDGNDQQTSARQHQHRLTLWICGGVLSRMTAVRAARGSSRVASGPVPLEPALLAEPVPDGMVGTLHLAWYDPIRIGQLSSVFSTIRGRAATPAAIHRI
jgi:hypothetical protein